MYIKFKKGNAYVYRAVRTGRRVRSEYVSAYWKFYADRGISWRQFTVGSFKSVVFLDDVKRNYLDTVDKRVDAAKAGNGIVLLPNGTLKHLGTTVGYKQAERS